MIGSTHILQDIDVSSLETLHRVHIENAIRKDMLALFNLYSEAYL